MQINVQVISNKDSLVTKIFERGQFTFFTPCIGEKVGGSYSSFKNIVRPLPSEILKLDKTITFERLISETVFTFVCLFVAKTGE